MSDLLEVLHIAGAVFVVGPMVLLPMFALRALRAGDGAQVRRFAGSALGFGIAAVVVAAIGFGVLAMADPERGWTLTTPWILGSIVSAAVAAGVHLGVVVPGLYRAAREPGAGTFGYALVATTSGLVAILMVVVVILMIVRPG
ncbi:conjugal transfer protein TrbL [Pseudolysinimonas sp.]|jgi:uncharacterized membrane protein|uniref:conjugal transfer protein TrbL n=1 Tax=Pseudolysinimonas sp. TaxID=2680009 RepID=UPI0037852A77